MMKKLVSGAALALCLFASCDKQLVEQVDLIPKPMNVTIEKGGFSLSTLQHLSAPEAWMPTAKLFCQDIKETSGLDIQVRPNDVFVLKMDESLCYDDFRLGL